MTQGQQENRRILWIIWYILLFGTMVACTSTEKAVSAPTPTLMVATIPVNETILENAEQLAVIVSTPDDMKAPISPTPSPLTPTPTLSSPHIIVRAGDTLLSIALAQDVSFNDLLDINDIDNLDDYLIRPNDILLLPPQEYFEQPDGQIHYKVKTGDTLESIAATYGIPVEILMSANPDIITPAELPIGYELIIPWGGIHRVALGETLSEISIRYGITLEDLVAANAQEYPELLLDINKIKFGWLLEIPSKNNGDAAISDEYDCSPQPPQIGVIFYMVKNRERLICFSSKFGISETTLLKANPDIWGGGRLTDDMIILIPPSDGALYTVTSDDAANNVTLMDIAIWYDIRVFDSMVDWQGRAVSLPLQDGQQLFIPDADPVALAFNVIVAKGLEQPISTPDTVVNTPEPTDAD